MRISDWSSDVCSSDLGDREAETGTTAMPRLQGVATQERIAGRGDLVGCHADPGVADGDDRRVLLTPGSDPHLAARPIVADGVVDQVAERLQQGTAVEIGRAHV